MSKITYADKVALNLNAGIPDVNKVKDTDMNDIKGAVNQIGAYNTAVAVTNGDFKTTLVGTLDTNDIILVSFPNATNGTSNARISIDNGVTYKNILDFVGTNVIASNIQASKRRLLYNGTSFVLDDVDYGSNSNGSYTRYKDGTINEWGTYSIPSSNVTWSALGNLFYSNSFTHYLPAKLINIDNINTSNNVSSRSANYDWACRNAVGENGTDTFLAFNLLSVTNNSRNITIYWNVKGKWK